MKIGIITTNFGRLPILEIFCAGIKRLREETLLDIPVVCVGDADGAETCKSYNIEHIVHPNKPLTDKFNVACQAFRGRVDAIMIMGSDNVISTTAFLSVVAEAEKVLTS